MQPIQSQNFWTFCPKNTDLPLSDDSSDTPLKFNSEFTPEKWWERKTIRLSYWVGWKVTLWRCYRGVEPKIWENPPNHPFVHRVFHYFSPSILGGFPLFLGTPI